MDETFDLNDDPDESSYETKKHTIVENDTSVGETSVILTKDFLTQPLPSVSPMRSLSIVIQCLNLIRDNQGLINRMVYFILKNRPFQLPELMFFNSEMQKELKKKCPEMWKLRDQQDQRPIYVELLQRYPVPHHCDVLLPKSKDDELLIHSFLRQFRFSTDFKKDFFQKFERVYPKFESICLSFMICYPEIMKNKMQILPAFITTSEDKIFGLESQKLSLEKIVNEHYHLMDRRSSPILSIR